MNRLPATREMLQSDSPILPADAARHLRAVRAKPGETVELFDGAGAVRAYSVEAGGSLRACGPVVLFPESPVHIALFACVTKGSRWDWTVEKAVELGVARIIPVVSERTIVRFGTVAEREAKAARWRRVAADAARQSCAVWMPVVEAPVDFARAVEEVRAFGGPVFAGLISDPPPPPIVEAWNAECRRAGAAPRRAAVFIGPEGDFTAGEAAALREAGAAGVSLGPTILRAETASIYAAAALSAAAEASRAEERK